MRRACLIPWALLAALASALPGPAAELVPTKPETVINQTTLGFQSSPSLAALGPAGMVAVWREDQEAPGGIKGRFLDTAGAPVGGEFWVERGEDLYFEPAVAGGFNGSFVVVWSIRNHILGRHYKDPHSPGTAFRISPPAGSVGRSNPGVAMDAAGNFVVVWYDETGSNFNHTLHARRFNAGGEPLGEPVRVDQERIGLPSSRGNFTPKVALHDNGSFLVTWDSGAGVRARRFDGPSGTWSTEVGLGFGALAVPVLHPEGDGAIVWADYLSDVQVRRMDAAGVPQGPAFATGTYFFEYAPLYPSPPAVVLDKSGHALVLWGGLKDRLSFADTDILGRLFDRSWQPLGETFALTTKPFNEGHPAVAASPAGGFTALWNSGSQRISIIPGPQPLPDPGLDGSDIGVAGKSFAPLCSPDAETLCLGPGGRFAARVTLRHPGNGGEGEGQPLALTRDTGAFWFFGAENLELMVKVLDGRGVNGSFWVYSAALSDVEYTLTVTDTVTGQEKTYHNAPGQLASRADVVAFPDPGAPVADSASGFASAETLRLGDEGRFEVEVELRDPRDGALKRATPIPLTKDTGAFWFFDSRNVELMIKVLDGRNVNGRFWIYYGALSDVRYTITVTDTVTGEKKIYENAPGRLVSRADVEAF
jgi:hypothetical protein